MAPHSIHMDGMEILFPRQVLRMSGLSYGLTAHERALKCCTLSGSRSHSRSRHGLIAKSSQRSSKTQFTRLPAISMLRPVYQS